MRPNDLFVADIDASFGRDYGDAYRAGLCALFYADGTHLATVQVAGSALDECVSVAALGAAVGADQAMWLTGVLVSNHPGVDLDPHAIPGLAYLAVRRDGEAAGWRRDLSMLDNGRMVGIGEMVRMDLSGSALVVRALAAWRGEHPDGNAEVIADFLRLRHHAVIIHT